MRVLLGSDHAGFELKEKVKHKLLLEGHEVIDFGTDSPDSMDYNDVALALSQKVAHDEEAKGILICGTGIGMSIQANKTKGIRAALVHDLKTAQLTRLHNDSNVLAMGGQIVEHNLALSIVSTWLETPFSDEERHLRRVRKITETENKS